MKKFLLALAVISAGFAGAAQAQFAKPEDAVKYRQSSLSVMGTHFGRVAGMAAGRIPYDAKAVQDNIDTAVFMSKLPWAGFVAGAESPKAKAEIWKDAAKFKELAEKNTADLVKVQTAAKTNNLDNLKAAMAGVTSCKACHDAYRN